MFAKSCNDFFRGEADNRARWRGSMTIQLDRDPETEARLEAAPEARGLRVEDYASSLLRESLPHLATETGRLTLESLRKMLHEMAKGSENLPILPPEATDRESFYEDRW